MIVHERGAALETPQGVLRQNRSARLRGPTLHSPISVTLTLTVTPIQTGDCYFSAGPSKIRTYFYKITRRAEDCVSKSAPFESTLRRRRCDLEPKLSGVSRRDTSTENPGLVARARARATRDNIISSSFSRALGSPRAR